MGGFFNQSAPENTGWVEENVYFGREIPSHEGVFRDLVFHPSQQCEEDERRAPLKTPVWEARGQGAYGTGTLRARVSGRPFLGGIVCNVSVTLLETIGPLQIRFLTKLNFVLVKKPFRKKQFLTFVFQHRDD